MGSPICVLNPVRNERTKPPERGETMRALELPPRLRLIAGWVPEGAYLADVGTDHAYLPNWLRLHGKIREAIASDLRPGPLERARNTGRLYGTDGIEYRLCSGLSGIRPSEVDTIVIAGMGGETILSILKAAPWTADGHHTLLLQPQTHEELVRQYLAKNGFIITREALVRDRGTLYTVMEARAGKAELTLTQIWGGVCLLQDPLADRYIIEKIVRTQAALAGAKRSARPADAERAEALRASADGGTAGDFDRVITGKRGVASCQLLNKLNRRCSSLLQRNWPSTGIMWAIWKAIRLRRYSVFWWHWTSRRML